jgi:G3E family GTPase
MSAMPEPPVPIPLDILTGFLGAGKTTLLNVLLRDRKLANAAVLVNEFGEIGLDHLLVQGVEGDMVTLTSGCVCCSIRGELVSALEDLLRRRDNRRMPAFDRVVVETTGLADPVPILGTVATHPYLSRRFTIGSVIAVVDAINGDSTLDAHEEARRQVAVADRLVLTKTDLAASADGISARLRRLNPIAPMLDAAKGRAHAEALLDGGPFGLEGKSADVARWLAADALTAAREAGGAADALAHGHAVHRHDERIRAVCLTHDRPVRAAALDLFLSLLRAPGAVKLLRMKGIVALAERPDRPLVIHAAGQLVHEPVTLSAWPEGERLTRLVLITEGADEAELRRLWDAVRGIPIVDLPDAGVLANNPLKPSAGGLLA